MKYIKPTIREEKYLLRIMRIMDLAAEDEKIKDWKHFMKVIHQTI